MSARALLGGYPGRSGRAVQGPGKVMMKMKELVVSPDFTMEDIYNIREYLSERWQLIGSEAFWAEIEAEALQAQAEIDALRRRHRAG